MKINILLLAIVMATSTSAQDLIQQYSGQLSYLQQPPVSVELDALVSDTLLFIVNEVIQTYS